LKIYGLKFIRSKALSKSSISKYGENIVLINLDECNICAGLLECVWTSKIKMAVSSDATLINQYINVFICKKCKHIQKIKNKKIDEIYKHYKQNDILDGLDQVKFVKSLPCSRTDVILKYIKKYLKNKKNLLDVGTGTGVFLRSCDRYTNLKLSAFDLNDTYTNNILDINQVEKFYSGDMLNIDSFFDAISLIHVLEHIENPIKFLMFLKSRLNKNGILIVQVPDIVNNNNDILIYDHLSHFTKQTVFLLLSQVFRSVFFIDTGINGELTIIASDLLDINNSYPKSPSINNFNYIDKINFSLSKANKPIYVFGTAPISTYFAGILDNKKLLKGFLDEDELKNGKNHLEKIIFHPKNIRNIICFIPLHQKISKKIKLTYPHIDFISIEDIE
jgi:SAM-dependent methyltransferase